MKRHLRGAAGPAIVLACALAAAPALAASIYALPQVLTDDRGSVVRLADWKGRPAIVTMEYANCRFLCSITLQRLKEVQAAADRQKREFAFLILSLDPKNDTPAEWTRYRKARDLNRDNWHFLTAHPLETPQLARVLDLRYWLYDGHIMHDFRLLRLNEAGEIVKVMDRFDADPDEFVR
jgi:cytochrome oxidase Cu insertion factor (SCO1/SenC/PrrC family)